MKRGFSMTWAVEPFAPQPGVLYSVDTTAHLAGVTRRSVLRYCKWGVVQPVIEPEFGALFFSDEGIRAIRQAEYLQDVIGVNGPGVRLIMSLVHELERRKQEAPEPAGAAS